MDFGQLIAARKDDIMRAWMSQVRKDRQIESDHNLTYSSVLDSLPGLIDAIAHLLGSSSAESASDIQEVLHTGLDHGELRAKQGYDASEIVREYALLRDVIFDTLEEKLLSSKPLVLLRTVRLVDGAIDQVVAVSLKRYTEERLKEVKLLYDEMLVSNQELDRLVRNEQMKMAHLAHELKSPLSCIIGYSDTFLRQKSAGRKPKLAFIEQVLSSGRKLLEMINETLELSAYRAGQIAVNITSVNPCEAVEEIATVMDTLAQQKGLSVGVNCAAAELEITTDRARLRQILMNLMSNAVRYTEKGEIKVSVDAVDSHVEIAIADTGLGIAAAEQDRVFEPYYQGRAGQDLPSSTGLGLAIAHQMVKLLQGSIQLQSEPDVGSTFTVILPMCYQHKHRGGPASESPASEQPADERLASESPASNSPVKASVARVTQISPALMSRSV